MDLPQPAIWFSQNQLRTQLDQIVDELAVQYNAEFCAVTLQGVEDSFLLAKHGLDFSLAPHRPDKQGEATFSFFRHHINRALPIIIGDAAVDPRVKDDPLVIGPPGFRFYAAAPLVTECGVYAGTVSIASRMPRTDFGLEDAERLRDVSAQVVQLLKSPRSRAGLQFGEALKA